MKYISLSPDVFFRMTPNGDVILYRTSAQKVFLLGGEIYTLLELIKTAKDADLIFDELNKRADAPVAREEFDKTIQQLSDLGIVSPAVILEERKRTLESSIKMAQYDAVHALHSVQFELTFRCNEHCRHCYCPRENEVTKELSTTEIKHVIDDLRLMNVVELTFTGGDLFVRNDAFEIMEYAYSQGFAINIFTNGTLLKDEDFYRLKKLYPRSIHFSIYNYIPEKHDAFTQLPGSFNKTTDAIKKCKLLGIPTNIKVSLVEENYEDVEGIMNLAKELGTTIQVSMQVTPTNNGGMGPTEHRLKSVELYADVMKKVDAHILLSCSGDFVSTFAKKKENPVCGAGAFSLNINPYGEVFPCNALLISCGNVRNTSISEIWNHSKTLQYVRSFRMDHLKGCENCSHKSQCDFCPGSAMQETGDPLGKYSEACTITEAKIIKMKGGHTNAES
ncbi:MAG: radical SAM protein [Clostridia bacterium]|nr:radical SAM protein [Clostridia bacterium]